MNEDTQNKTLALEENRSLEIAEETVVKEREPVMTYEDAAGKEHEEPACALCVERFAFNDPQRNILERSLDFVLLCEHFSIADWHELTGQVGRSDWYEFNYLCWIKKALKKAAGLFCLSLAQIRALLGSVHLAIAADVIPPDERDQALEVLRFFNRFRRHLRNDEGHNIVYAIVDTLDEPHYVGSLELERARSLSSQLRWKTMEEISVVFQAELDGTLERIRSNLATAHFGRKPRLSVLATAMYNSISIIRAETKAWFQRAKESKESADLNYLANEIHEQVFVIDELLAMGCKNNDSNLSTNGGYDLYRAVDGIRELVDWDECPALKQRMEQGEQTWARTGTSKDDEEDEGC